MIRADRKRAIDKTIKRVRKLGDATFPFIPNDEEYLYFEAEMARFERRAARLEMLKILGVTFAGLGALVLGSWAIVNCKG